MSYKNKLVINMGDQIEFDNIDKLNMEIQSLEDDFKYAIVDKANNLFQIHYDHDSVQFWNSEEFTNLLAKHLTNGNIYIDIIGEDGDRIAYDINPKRYEIIDWMPKVTKNVNCKIGELK